MFVFGACVCNGLDWVLPLYLLKEQGWERERLRCMRLGRLCEWREP